MQQMGHRPEATLTVYTQQMQRLGGEREQLRALVQGAREVAAQPREAIAA